MSAFPDYTPDTIGCGSRYRVAPTWGPRSMHNRGAPQFTAFRKFLRSRYAFEIAWTLLSKDNAFVIDRMVRGQLATFLPFDWFDWYPFWWRAVYVGKGDGVTTQWLLPAKEVTDVTIYAGGPTFGGGTDRTFIGGNLIPRVGSNLEDAVSLFAPPASGRPIWAYFRGRRRFNVRFGNDNEQTLTRDLETGLYNVTMRIAQTKVMEGR